MKKLAAPFAALALAAGLAGCSTKAPVVYPNAHLEKVGSARYEADLAACMEKAEAYAEAPSRTGEAAERAAEGAIIGAAAGAAAGAVSGRSGASAGARAAGRGTSGFLSSLFGADRPHPVIRRFVERCMREKGYDIIGWG
jgi:outer membrane lipoprotein SlyB